ELGAWTWLMSTLTQLPAVVQLASAPRPVQRNVASSWRPSSDSRLGRAEGVRRRRDDGWLGWGSVAGVAMRWGFRRNTVGSSRLRDSSNDPRIPATARDPAADPS